MICVGIDAVSMKHDVCIANDKGEQFGKVFTIKNTKDDYEKLLGRIQAAKEHFNDADVRLGIESTGSYSAVLTEYLAGKDGLDPIAYESGAYKARNTRISQKDEAFHASYEKKIAKEKKNKVVLGHISKKLGRLIFCLLRLHKNYVPRQVGWQQKSRPPSRHVLTVPRDGEIFFWCFN